MGLEKDTYKQALATQWRNQTVELLHKLLEKPKETLEQKLKNPNSVESKLLETMIGMVAATQAFEGLMVKAAAELHHIERLIEKDHKIRSMNKDSTFYNEEELEEEQIQLNQPGSLAILEQKLNHVRDQIADLKAQQAQLDEQYEGAITEVKETYNQALANTFADFKMVAEPEQIERLYEINEYKIDAPKVIDVVTRSYEEAQQKNESLGLPPPPPPPPPAVMNKRMAQREDLMKNVMLFGALTEIYKNNHNSGSVQETLKILPLITAVIEGRKGALEKLDQYFEANKARIDQQIVNLEGVESTLRSEISKLFDPRLAPSFNTRSPASEKDSEKEEDKNLTQSSSSQRLFGK